MFVATKQLKLPTKCKIMIFLEKKIPYLHDVNNVLLFIYLNLWVYFGIKLLRVDNNKDQDIYFNLTISCSIKFTCWTDESVFRVRFFQSQYSTNNFFYKFCFLFCSVNIKL